MIDVNNIKVFDKQREKQLLNYNKIDITYYKLPHELDIHNSSFIYGEVNAKDIIDIIKMINSEEEQNSITTFLDIGSGCGKLILSLVLEFDNLYGTGIEIHKERYEYGMNILDTYGDYFENINTNIHEKIEFINEDFMKTYFGNYDCLYCCNLVFTKEDNKKLYSKILHEFAGYVILFNYNHELQPYLRETYFVNTSWEKKVSIFLFYI